MAVGASCALSGILLGARLIERVKDLENAQAVILAIVNRLSFTLASPEILIAEMAYESQFKRCDYLSLASEEISKGSEFIDGWKNSVSKSNSCLSHDDRAILAQVGDILGCSDIDTQLGNLNLLIQRLKFAADGARERSASDCKLAKTLGALTGFAVVVMII